MSETLTQTLARNPIAAAGIAPGDGFPVLDVSATGLAKDALMIMSELRLALSTGSTHVNSSGNTTIQRGLIAVQHLAVVTFSGAAGTRGVILSTAEVPAINDRLTVRCALPATADIIVEFRNATAGGTLITSLDTDGSGDDAVHDFYFDGSAWQFLAVNYPSNA